MRPQDLLELILLAAVWGASFLFMRTATPEFGAIALVAVRTGVAAIFLLPILLISRKHLDVSKHWKPILFVGLVNTALPFCLFRPAKILKVPHHHYCASAKGLKYIKHLYHHYLILHLPQGSSQVGFSIGQLQKPFCTLKLH